MSSKREGFSRVKTTKIGNQRMVMKKVNQGGNHGKPFTFYDKKRSWHGRKNLFFLS